MLKLKPEQAKELMLEIINDPDFIKHQKPLLSDFMRKKYGLTERQQARVEVRLERILDYLIR